MRRVWALVGCIAMALARPVRADEPDNSAAALHRFEEGRAAFEAKRYDDAVIAFGDSYRLLPSPNSRLYLARAYERLGKVASAYVNFRLTAREANDRLVATGEKRYSLTRDAAVAEEGDLEPRVPRLTLAVPGGVPDGYLVTANGKLLPRAAWGVAIEMDPGPVAIDAGGQRIKPFHTQIDLAEGEQRRVDVAAERVPTAILTLRFRVRPAGMAVNVDRVPVDPDRLEGPMEVDAGPHVVEIRAPGYAAFRWGKALADGARQEVPIDLVPEDVSRSRGTPKELFFAAAGAAVVFLGSGVYLGLHAASLSAAQKQIPSPYLRDPSVKDAVDTDSTLAYAFDLTAAAFGAGAVLLAFTSRWRTDARPASAPAVSVVPWRPVGGGGLSVVGRF